MLVRQIGGPQGQEEESQRNSPEPPRRGGEAATDNGVIGVGRQAWRTAPPCRALPGQPPFLSAKVKGKREGERYLSERTGRDASDRAGGALGASLTWLGCDATAEGERIREGLRRGDERDRSEGSERAGGQAGAAASRVSREGLTARGAA